MGRFSEKVGLKNLCVFSCKSVEEQSVDDQTERLSLLFGSSGLSFESKFG